jgi:chromosome segregation ATPase
VTEDQQRHLDFLRACVDYYERTVEEQENSLARLQDKVEEAQAELTAMQEALVSAQGALDRANEDAEGSRSELAAYLEELDSGGPVNEDESPVAGTGVGANNATIRTEES